MQILNYPSGQGRSIIEALHSSNSIHMLSGNFIDAANKKKWKIILESPQIAHESLFVDDKKRNQEKVENIQMKYAFTHTATC